MKKILIAIAVLMFSAACFANTIVYHATLLGTTEVPPNASPGTGFATVTVNTGANTMEVDVTFTGLLGTTTASHIHCCTAAPDTGNAGVATTVPTFTGFPLGVTSGTYDHTLDLTSASSYNPSFVTAQGGLSNAEAALLAGMADGKAYLNIHSTVVPGGEIRGFLVAATPEPSSLTLLISSLAGILIRRRRKQ